MSDRPGPGPGVPPELAGGRSSFSSIREQSTLAGLAQTFTQSRVSSITGELGRVVPHSPPNQTAVLDDSSLSGQSGQHDDNDGEYVSPLTQPISRLHSVWYPSVAGLRSWKQISLGGRMASRSCEDFKRVDLGVWKSPADVWEAAAAAAGTATAETQPEPEGRSVGLAPLELLPAELLGTCCAPRFYFSIRRSCCWQPDMLIDPTFFIFFLQRISSSFSSSSCRIHPTPS